jgi:hypothetical protein
MPIPPAGPTPPLPEPPATERAPGAPRGNRNAAKGHRALSQRLQVNLSEHEMLMIRGASTRAKAPNLAWYARDVLRRSAGLGALPKP